MQVIAPSGLIGRARRHIGPSAGPVRSGFRRVESRNVESICEKRHQCVKTDA